MSDTPHTHASVPAAPHPAAIAGISPAQGELIPLEEQPDGFWSGEEQSGRYTARRFFLKRPDDYQLCIELLAAGAGLLKIARILKVHHRTVAAVRDSEGEKVDIAKQRIRANLRLAAEVGSERLPEIMETIPASQLAVALGITLDKLRDADGEPTQRIEHTHEHRLTHESLIADIQAFPDAKDAEEAHFTMDSGAGESGQKALPAASANAAAPAQTAPAPATPNPAKSDS